MRILTGVLTFFALEKCEIALKTWIKLQMRKDGHLSGSKGTV